MRRYIWSNIYIYAIVYFQEIIANKQLYNNKIVARLVWADRIVPAREYAMRRNIHCVHLLVRDSIFQIVFIATHFRLNC